jgi:manganese transport protein
MVPALAAIGFYGEGAATSLLVFSQVVLSLQLPFAVYPLVRFTNSRQWMGGLANGPLTAIAAWAVTAALIGLNGWLLVNAVS